ncbi:MAG: FHA domain-containing protein [Archangium sp.]|nr:FHA domain-containing protein [Archangium sp.]
MARRIYNSPTGAVKVPALIWEMPPNHEDDEGESWAVTDAGPKTKPSAREPLVMLVEKVPGTNNPFAMGVTVGRVETNDIIVDDASVSRFHAYLQLDERVDGWFLTDADSNNGTWVDGVKVVVSTRVRLADGAVIRFGDAKLRFFMPDSVVKWVRQQGGKT